MRRVLCKADSLPDLPLKEGLLRVVQVSLLGSILSNMLLVLGCAFLVGGIKHPVQHYSKAAAITNSGLCCYHPARIMDIALSN